MHDPPLHHASAATRNFSPPDQNNSPCNHVQIQQTTTGSYYFFAHMISKSLPRVGYLPRFIRPAHRSGHASALPESVESILRLCSPDKYQRIKPSRSHGGRHQRWWVIAMTGKAYKALRIDAAPAYVPCVSGRLHNNNKEARRCIPILQNRFSHTRNDQPSKYRMDYEISIAANETRSVGQNVQAHTHAAEYVEGLLLLR